MATSVQDIYKRFLAQIGKDVIAELEQELAEEEFETICDSFGIKDGDKREQLQFLLKSMLTAQLNSNDDLKYMNNKPKVNITLE